MNYLKALLEDPRTDIAFIGYQAKGNPRPRSENTVPARVT